MATVMPTDWHRSQATGSTTTGVTTAAWKLRERHIDFDTEAVA